MVNTSFGESEHKVEVPYLTQVAVLAQLQEEVVAFHDARGRYEEELVDTVIANLLDIVSMVESFTYIPDNALHQILTNRAEELLSQALSITDHDSHSLHLRSARYVQRVIQNLSGGTTLTFQASVPVEKPAGSVVAQELAAKLRMNNDPLGSSDESLWPDVAHWYMDSEQWHEELAQKIETLPSENVSNVTDHALEFVQKQQSDPGNIYRGAALAWSEKIIQGWSKAAMKREKDAFKERLNNGGSRLISVAREQEPPPVEKKPVIQTSFLAGLEKLIFVREQESWNVSREAWHVFWKARSVMEENRHSPVFEVTAKLQEICKDVNRVYSKHSARVAAAKELEQLVKTYVGGV